MEHETGTPEGPADVVGQGGQGATRARRTATVATGVAIAVAAGGAAWAASGTETESPSASPSQTESASPSASPSPSASGEAGVPGHGRGHLEGGTEVPDGADPAESATEGPGRWGRGLPHGPGLGGVLHGEAVVPDGEAYRDVAFQRGTVSAVSPTSLTVKSEDGFSRTYVLDADTVVDGTQGDASTLAEGDTVCVLADVDGSTATATRVQERELGGAGVFGEGPGRWGGRGPHGPRGDDSTGGSTEGSTEGSSGAPTGRGTVGRA